MSEKHFEKIGEKDCVLNIIHLFHWPRILNRLQQLWFESDFPVNRLNCFPIFSGSLPEILSSWGGKAHMHRMHVQRTLKIVTLSFILLSQFNLSTIGSNSLSVWMSRPSLGKTHLLSVTWIFVFPLFPLKICTFMLKYHTWNAKLNYPSAKPCSSRHLV